MSDFSQGPGWWQASDGKWYPPESAPGAAPTAPASPFGGPPAPGYGAGPGYGAPPGYGPAPGYIPGATASGLPSVYGLAVASMVLGIVGTVFFCFWPIAIPCGVIGLPLGGVAFSRMNKGTADPRGKGQATAGIVLSIVAIAVSVIFIIAVVNSDEYDDDNWYDRPVIVQPEAN